jgi:2-hydroxy-6-oxonona-2,4-dienedioate hydrolase
VPVTEPLAHGFVGAGAGPVTVVLHGGGPGCHARSDFAGVMTLRPDRRFLWVDLPGYGGSPADAPSIGGAARALDELLTHLGLTGVEVLAQSLGGTVALRLAADRPDRIGRIVLIGSQPVPGGMPGLGSRVRAQYYGREGPTPEKMRALLAELEWHDATRIPDATVQARYAASMRVVAAAPAEDLGPVLAAVEVPTLVVWGRHDPFAGPDYAAALADALPRGDLAVVGRTAHHPQAERPETVAALADAHFTQRSR